jgi:hypothetical protein
MKKLLVIMLMLMYGFSSTGMTLQLHYCCGKLKSIKWTPAQESGCGSKHKMGSKPCCENKQLSNKVKADHDNYQPVVKSFKVLPEVVKHAADSSVLSSKGAQLSPVAFAPPPLVSQPLFIRNRVLRI